MKDADGNPILRLNIFAQNLKLHLASWNVVVREQLSFAKKRTGGTNASGNGGVSLAEEKFQGIGHFKDKKREQRDLSKKSNATVRRLLELAL